VRSSPPQRVKSPRDLDRRRMGAERDIARLKAKILRNHRQVERIRQQNLRLTARLTEIEGRNPAPSAVRTHPDPVTADDRLQLAAVAPKLDRHRPQQRSLAWLIICTSAIALLALGCGCIGFAIARVLLR
jgi:uncharacterized coiled-coil protein SlyX